MSPASAWHALHPEEAAARVEARLGGLSAAEAAARLERHGPNRLPGQKAVPLWLVLVHQFRSPLIYALAAAAAAALLAGEAVDAAFIGAVLLLNAAIGGVQEWRAERSSLALQQLLRTRATVVRDGHARDVDAQEVVPGDLVAVESGGRVPADLRLLLTEGVQVDESLLTGESLPVGKDARWIGPEGAALGDRRNLLFAGTIVTRGRVQGLAVATGVETVVGRLAKSVSSAGAGDPPLLVRMQRFTRIVGIVVLAASAVTVALAVWVRGEPAAEAFLFGVALAVSAIPEGLPVAMTVALSVAARRMAKRGVVVRRLAAVEGLGSCTYIASDKTGTLTCNELTVRRVELPSGRTLEATGEGYAPAGTVRIEDGPTIQASEDPELARLVEVVVLCNEAELHEEEGRWRWRGDPTEVALLAFAAKAGVFPAAVHAARPRINRIPFEPERRFSATFHAEGELTFAAVLGAPERVLAMCDTASPDLRGVAERQATKLAAAGYRVLACGAGRMPLPVTAEDAPPAPSGLRFLGFVGMIDPLRPGAREAVEACGAAGIRVAMVTGDHPVTALAISRELGLARDEMELVTGADLERAPPEDLPQIVARTRVFARTSPQQKLDIVRAAQAAGHFVAVTGDGVNDAPALRAANIGVAMGRSGTDVAREAAELVLTDDRFPTIVAGVEEGRVAYDNVRKVIYLLVSTGATEVLLVLAALATGLPLPLLPAQFLWLNLVTNGIQDVALAFEPAEGDVLRRRPRPPRERIFDRLMVERTLVAASVMAAAAYFVFDRLIAAGYAEDAARNVLLLLLVLFENVHIGNCRSETQSLFRLSPLRSPILLAGALAALGVHVLAMHFGPLQTVLRTAPVPLGTWLWVAAVALLPAVAIEVHKLTLRFRPPPR